MLREVRKDVPLVGLEGQSRDEDGPDVAVEGGELALGGAGGADLGRGAGAVVGFCGGEGGEPRVREKKEKKNNSDACLFLFLSLPPSSSSLLLTVLACCAASDLEETETWSGGNGPCRAPRSGTSSERSVRRGDSSGRRRTAATAAAEGEGEQQRTKGLLLLLLPRRCSRLLCLLHGARARRTCFFYSGWLVESEKREGKRRH